MPERSVGVPQQDLGEREHVGVEEVPGHSEGGEGESDRREDAGVDPVVRAVHATGGGVLDEDVLDRDDASAVERRRRRRRRRG